MPRARRSSILAPSAASLPDGFRIRSQAPTALLKSLGRLSRTSLIDLVLQWLDQKCLLDCRPYSITHRSKEGLEDDANPYEVVTSIPDLKQIYIELRDRKGGKREVVDRILEGDWRHGLTLLQLATADIRYLDDNPSSAHQWTALLLDLKLTPQQKQAAKNGTIPCTPGELTRFNGASFVKSIQSDISPLVKAHYHVSRSANLPLTYVRIFIIDSPYQYPRQSPNTFTDASRIVFLAFPDSSPYIYSSLFSIPAPRGAVTSSTSQPTLTTDTRTLRRIVMHAIPKAFSRPHHRYSLKTTALTTRNLHTLLALRGPGRTNQANGAFSIFADSVVEQSPLDPRLPSSVSTQRPVPAIGNAVNPATEKENIPQEPVSRAPTKLTRPHPDPSDQSSRIKRQKHLHTRFGTTGPNRQPLKIPFSNHVSDTSAALPESINPALERFEVHLRDPITPGDATETTLSLTFSGSDVMSGLRQLADLGVVDAERMPAWMTGEEGVSSAVIRDGVRIVDDHRLQLDPT